MIPARQLAFSRGDLHVSTFPYCEDSSNGSRKYFQNFRESCYFLGPVEFALAYYHSSRTRRREAMWLKTEFTCIISLFFPSILVRNSILVSDTFCQ